MNHAPLAPSNLNIAGRPFQSSPLLKSKPKPHWKTPDCTETNTSYMSVNNDPHRLARSGCFYIPTAKFSGYGTTPAYFRKPIKD